MAGGLALFVFGMNAVSKSLSGLTDGPPGKRPRSFETPYMNPRFIRPLSFAGSDGSEVYFLKKSKTP